jgi:hypothetical protein
VRSERAPDPPSDLCAGTERYGDRMHNHRSVVSAPVISRTISHLIPEDDVDIAPCARAPAGLLRMTNSLRGLGACLAVRSHTAHRDQSREAEERLPFAE